MDIAQHQNTASSSRRLLVALILLAIRFGGIDAYAYEENLVYEDIVESVDYTYELFSSKIPERACRGSLKMTVKEVADVKVFIVDLSIGLPSRMEFPQRASFYPGDSITVYEIKDKIFWGAYFRVRALLNDGTNLVSPIYYVSDYIDEADLELLKAQSGVEEIEDVPVSIAVRDGALRVEVAGTAHLDVADVSGRVIFSNDVHHAEEISLDCACSPLIIVRYTDSNQTITKKIAIR